MLQTDPPDELAYNRMKTAVTAGVVLLALVFLRVALFENHNSPRVRLAFAIIQVSIPLGLAFYRWRRRKPHVA